MCSIAFINGQFMTIDKAYVNIEDRGYQFGDGVYEVVYVYEGVPFALEDHLERFFNSLNSVKIQTDYTKQDIEQIIYDGLKEANLKYAEIYFQITRGTSRRTHTFPEKVSSNFVLNIQPGVNPPTELWEKGASVSLAKDIRWSRCDIKSLNLLPNVLAKQEARDNGYFESVLYRDGYIIEGSSTNIFIVENNQIYTYPANSHILGGITRKHIISLAESINIKVNQIPFTVEQLYHANEVFLTGTYIEVLPVTKVNSEIINNGLVGPITKKLNEEYKKWINNECGLSAIKIS
ncbi:MAG: hypothetical protein VR72_09980 [Clostridiaceae bacterium BRH_c20a]|nr:MAG: hypothetical protein VR72_09980 [Clostridiaceae bacterium BRH_c20a]